MTGERQQANRQLTAEVNADDIKEEEDVLVATAPASKLEAV